MIPCESNLPSQANKHSTQNDTRLINDGNQGEADSKLCSVKRSRQAEELRHLPAIQIT